MDHEAAQLERRHVHRVYESTARYLRHLQGKAWPRVRQFLQDQQPGSLIADIGCGTGKYLQVNSQVHTLGCDYCGPLVEIARSRGCEVMVCDNLNLPFRDQGFDAIISIGVIHHFSTQQRRVRAIKEMARLLAPGGRLMIYVWAMEQQRRRFEKQDVLVPWNRALCASRPLSEGSPPGPGPGPGPDPHPGPGPDPGPGCPGCCGARRGSRRPHSAGPAPGGRSPEPGAERGLYGALGRSLRAWLCPGPPEEGGLRRPRGRPEAPVSAQPARHASWDGGPRGPRPARRAPSPDEDVFVEAPAPERVGRPPGGGEPRGGAGGPAGGVARPTLEEGEPCARGGPRRVPPPGPADSLPGGAVLAVGGQRPDAPGAAAFMRYYHVFREGELCGLLRDNVSELHILSSGNDHGNWCIIAEKRGEPCG